MNNKYLEKLILMTRLQSLEAECNILQSYSVRVTYI